MKNKFLKVTPMIAVAILSSSTMYAFGQNGNGQSQSEQPMVQINKQEQVMLNAEDSAQGTAEQNQNEVKKVIINKGENQQLQVQTENAEQEMQLVGEGQQNQVLFELKNESGDTQLRIRQEDGECVVEENDAQVHTDLPLTVDTETGVIYVTTASGKVIELSEHPSEVLQEALSARIDTLEGAVLGESTEVEDQIRYRVTGTDARRFLWLFGVEVPVEVEYNAETGEEVELIQPWYITWFGFLFAN